jgi:protein-S-isoprenylcysteine O-methyltransferase Ste14
VLVWIVLVVLTPLALGSTTFYLGLFVYFLGWLGMITALLNYRDTPLDQPVTHGIYRISRHPQQLALSLAFLGISIATGSGLSLILICLGLVGGHWKILEEEKACLAQYGEAYQSYMETIPRYFLFF